MHYVALATDYDGTIARDGAVDAATFAALERLQSSGRRLILVTGRQLDDLIRVLPRLDLFDRVVAENGALLYRPDTREERALATPPPPEFAQRLRERQVNPLSIGRVIVASRQPNEGVVLDAIRELGLELQIIFNKGAVMVLPPGVNKESGLRAALADLDLLPLNCVGVGDAENDFAFLDACGTSVAVANAIDSLKAQATIVTRSARGAGVAELIDQIVGDDLAAADMRNSRQQVVLGTGIDIPPHRMRLLLAGGSGGGKSTLAFGWLERLTARGFQYCIIDPEGDYETVEAAVTIGTAKEAPIPAAVADLLRKTSTSVAVNLLGLKLHDRPAYYAQLLPELKALRARIGRPHVIVVDEAHHMLPAAKDGTTSAAEGRASHRDVERGMMFITVDPAALPERLLESIERVIAVGDTPEATVSSFLAAHRLPLPEPIGPLPKGEAVSLLTTEPVPHRFKVIPGEGIKERHLRKYAEGNLGEDKSFYFRGPKAQLNLRARNLLDFLNLADGVDDATFTFHRERGDYSRWLDTAIKDQDLASEVAGLEKGPSDVASARGALREAIERRYTLPAS